MSLRIAIFGPCLWVSLACFNPRRRSADCNVARRQRSRILRNQNPPRPRAALLQMPLGQREEIRRGLLLDSREGIQKGGDRGPAIVPKDTDKSILLNAILHTDADLRMPPKKERLSKEVLNDFTAWIRMGAPDPREKAAAGLSGPVDIATGRKFWSMQPPKSHPLPSVKKKGWPTHKLDHFILARLEAAGLSPSDDAQPATLLRRLHFDLVGLPPSPAATQAFLSAVQNEGIRPALEREVDAAPGFSAVWRDTGAAIGWMSRALPNRAAKRRTCRSLMPGAIAIT
jgi:hypothetical protein